MSTIILNGSRISANKIKQAGFKFKFENLEKALKIYDENIPYNSFIPFLMQQQNNYQIDFGEEKKDVIGVLLMMVLWVDSLEEAKN